MWNKINQLIKKEQVKTVPLGKNLEEPKNFSNISADFTLDETNFLQFVAVSSII